MCSARGYDYTGSGPSAGLPGDTVTIPLADLDGVAHTVAAQSRGLDFDDVKQDVWERYLRCPPRTIGGAWVIARNVRNTLWRRERRRLHPPLDDVPELADASFPDTIEAREMLQRAYQLRPAWVRWLLHYGGSSRNGEGRSAHQRVRVYRMRKELRRLLAL